MFELIRRMTQSIEAGIIFTTHSMSEAENLCSHIAIMINGNIECIGKFVFL